jgi:3-hydroxymyristoyl/3-hydroxydecanoyl-(acyl carrier protein) dehydratase
VVAPGWSPARLRDALRVHFDPVVLPRRIACLDRLPREANGKLRRDRLLVAAADRQRSPSTFDVRPRAGSAREFDVHVPPNLLYFDGHFDTDPILAGVVQLEVLVARQIASMWPELGPIQRITRLRFRRPIRPGEDLRLTVERPSPDRVDFEIHVGDRSCSSGTLHYEA